MDRQGVSVCVVLLLVTILGGCANAPKPAIREPFTAGKLLTFLQQEGVALTHEGPATQPMFEQTGQAYFTEGSGRLLLFEYDSDAAAAQDAARMERNRELIVPPHFYRRGSLVVLYDGNDPEMLRILQTGLGKKE